MKKYLISLALLVTLFFIGGITVQASTDTDPGIKPGSFLYIFDTTFEKIGLFFTFSPEEKARKALTYADERLAEAKEVANDNNTKAIEEAMDGYEKEISLATEKSEELKDDKKKEELLNIISENTAKHQESLAVVLDKVPDGAKEAILKAIEVSKRGQEEALKQVGELQKEVVGLKQKVAELEEEIKNDESSKAEELKNKEKDQEIEKARLEAEMAKAKAEAEKNKLETERLKQGSDTLQKDIITPITEFNKPSVSNMPNGLNENSSVSLPERPLEDIWYYDIGWTKYKDGKIVCVDKGETFQMPGGYREEACGYNTLGKLILAEGESYLLRIKPQEYAKRENLSGQELYVTTFDGMVNDVFTTNEYGYADVEITTYSNHEYIPDGYITVRPIKPRGGVATDIQLEILPKGEDAPIVTPDISKNKELSDVNKEKIAQSELHITSDTIPPFIFSSVIRNNGDIYIDANERISKVETYAVYIEDGKPTEYEKLNTTINKFSYEVEPQTCNGNKICNSIISKGLVSNYPTDLLNKDKAMVNYRVYDMSGNYVQSVDLWFKSPESTTGDLSSVGGHSRQAIIDWENSSDFSVESY